MPTLICRYDALVCDLDGVVYKGRAVVPHAPESLAAARAHGVGLVFATNNASRTPQDVVAKLAAVGVAAQPGEVLTSSMAGAHRLAQVLDAQAPVLAVGGPGVAAALLGAGLTPVTARESQSGAEVVGVLQGYGTGVDAADLAEAAYAVEGGARWVATNTDRTLPTDRGVAPGNGTLVDAVRQAVGQEPEVVGKPGPLMYEMATSLLGSDVDRTLGIGDRIETDIAGAHAAHLDALHVLTGVHGPNDLLAAPPSLRPRYVARDLRALHEPYDEPVEEDGCVWCVPAVRAAVTGAGSTLSLDVEARRECPGDQMEVAVLRVALAALWQAIDTGDATAAQAIAALPPTAPGNAAG